MERAVAVSTGRPHFIARVVLVAGVALATVGVSDTAKAQGLFDALRSIFGGSRPPAQRIEPPMLLDGFPEDGIRAAPGEGGPYVAYCVRLCDGRYFPLPRNTGSQSMTPDKICSAMCPAAATKIFSGTNISRAVANDGKNYSSMKNAFVYREKMVDGCSCSSGASTGTAALDVEQDPTLRRGDIVVTRDGPKVFTGDSRLPHKPSDFVPADGYKGLPKSVRQELSEMRVAEEVTSAPAVLTRAAPALVPPTILPPDPAGPHASLTYMPVAAAFSTSLTR
jgi:hypothetical protein